VSGAPAGPPISHFSLLTSHFSLHISPLTSKIPIDFNVKATSFAHWPIVVGFLGVTPSAPTNTLTVVPCLPSTWSELSVRALRVGSAEVEVSARHSGKRYETRVGLPRGWNLTIGYA
jgi:hypothetical protein